MRVDDYIDGNGALKYVCAIEQIANIADEKKKNRMENLWYA